MTEGASNFDPSATKDNGSCKYPTFDLQLMGNCDGSIKNMEIYPANVAEWKKSVIANGEPHSGMEAAGWASFNASTFPESGKKLYTDFFVGDDKYRQTCKDLENDPVVFTSDVDPDGDYIVDMWQSPDIGLPLYNKDGKGIVMVKK